MNDDVTVEEDKSYGSVTGVVRIPYWSPWGLAGNFVLLFSMLFGLNADDAPRWAVFIPLAGGMLWGVALAFWWLGRPLRTAADENVEKADDGTVKDAESSSGTLAEA